MLTKHPSDSTEQQQAEKIVIASLNEAENLSLKKHQFFFDNIQIQVDGYSEEPAVLCEVYVRIGKMGPAHCSKITKDMLKMLLIEKIEKKSYRKIIAFIDSMAASIFLESTKWYSTLKEHFNFEIKLVTVPEELKEGIKAAQVRQRMVNPG